MAHDIGWYRKQHKRMHEQLTPLRREIEQLSNNIAARVAEAEAPLKTELSATLARINDQLNVLGVKDEQLENSAQTIESLQAAFDAMVKSSQATFDAMVAEKEAVIAKHEATILALTEEQTVRQPVVDEAQERIDAANALLASHLERMNKREREYANALLNRKILAAAVPRPNRK